MGGLSIGIVNGAYGTTAGNHRLVTLAGLEALTEVNGDLEIGYNPVLQSVSGLDQLHLVRGDLTIRFNDALGDVTALHGLAWVKGDLHVADNPSLGNANAQALADAIGTIGGGITVERN